MQTKSLRETNPTKWLTVTALFMAINVALSSFGVPVPGGHIYLNDIAICIASILLDPLGAYLVGGFGAFLGDLIFYPTPMFVSLVTRGIQAIVIAVLSKKAAQPVKSRSILAVSVGAVIMVLGYSIGRAFFYGTPAQTLAKLPFQIAQAALGAVVAVVLIFRAGLLKVWDKFCAKK